MVNVQVINVSSYINDIQLDYLIKVVNKSLKDVSEYLLVRESHLIHFIRETPDPTIVLCDTLNEFDPYTVYLPEDRIFSVIPVETFSKNGVGFLDSGEYTIAGFVFKDSLLATHDPYCNHWLLTRDGMIFDDRISPVFGNLHKSSLIIPRTQKLISTSLPDIVLPEWSNHLATTTHLTVHKTQVSPLKHTSKGYLIIVDPTKGTLEIIFGEDIPLWLKEYLSRSWTLRRIVRNFPVVNSTITDLTHTCASFSSDESGDSEGSPVTIEPTNYEKRSDKKKITPLSKRLFGK